MCGFGATLGAMRVAILCTILLVCTNARADEVAGVVIDDAKLGVADVEVRIVGATVVVTTRSDRRGQFRVNGLPPGDYRIEVERGTVREPYPLPVRIARSWARCCSCRAATVHLATHRRGHVDTASTALGIRITSPGR